MERLHGAQAGDLRALMRGLPLWADFADEDLDLLLAAGAIRLCRFAAGETVVEEGNYEKSFFVLLGGAVRAIRGGRQVAAMAGPGTVFGEMSFILGKGRTATVVADGPGECLVVDMGYVDFLPSPEREDFLIRIFRRLAAIVSDRLGSANARKAALLTAMRERREALRAHVARERETLLNLRRELSALDTADDEEVLRQLLDRRF
ncbi:cyclic nucleotide-binding protein [Solidesulfovibrio carbinoliphilus subsp. oakridgensis]|uniref:Cyclic nucleotide-binding protein n=1 Tax=Solidesulfovibrio carbinoliphilus subsp. oakridgensis TaxID=694327 RepID=G7QA53_9BACT|nr:cyclic nucleotide-binding domain-containing protein [Solidesulfovibrio carbinoliphilus]EHJ47883.1 cyclic nucleotide-binding protein [Solidesulfovibrio carbinoliphilus subsp. oakridgensis]